VKASSIGLSTIILVVLFVTGCGLKYIPNVGSESQWRSIDGQKVAMANTNNQPAMSLPTEILIKKIKIRGTYVVVFDIQDKSKKLKHDEVEGLTDYLSSSIAEGGMFHVIPRDQIKKRLRQQKKDSHKKCYEQSCQVEIGREMAAQKSLSVTISSIGSTCIVTAAILDLKNAATDATATARGKCSSDSMLTKIEEIVAKFRKMAI
jgi:PBP1b-binding outer membrane lipoprotein LpoB